MTEIKPNDKAIEAARAAILKAMAERNCIIAGVPFNDKNYDEFEACEAAEHAKVALDAAYAAQFQSEDYAGLVKELRERAGSYDSHDYHREIELKAADALEAVLADRDIYKNWLDNYEKLFAAKVEELVTARLERDALAARLAPVDDEVLVERDALKKAVEAEQSMTKLRLGPFLKKVRQEKQMTLRAVEEATGKEISNAYLSQLESGKVTKPSPHVLYTLSLVFGVAYETLMERAGYIMPAPNRLAPVDDDELVEIAAYYFTDGSSWSDLSERLRNNCRRDAREIIAAIRPHIEAAERERCAKIAAEGSFAFDIETWMNSTKKEMTAHVSYAIAAAIRSGK